MKLGVTFSNALCVVMLVAVASFARHPLGERGTVGARGSPTEPPVASPEPEVVPCPRACCNVEARIDALKDRIADEERWFAALYYLMPYPPFKSMPWKHVYPDQATDLQVDTEWLRNVDLKAVEGFLGTDLERHKMLDEIETRLEKVGEMRRAFVRDVYLKVYKIPAEDPIYKVL